MEAWSKMLKHSSEQRVRHCGELCLDVLKCERSYHWPSAYLRVWINAERFRQHSRRYSPPINHKRTEPTRHWVFHTKHITYFKRWKIQLNIDVVTITLHKLASPFLLTTVKGQCKVIKIQGRRRVWNGDREIALIMGERQVPIDNPFNQMGWKKILFKDFS